MTDWQSITRLLPGYDPWVNADGYRFDEERADLVVDFFVECLVFIEGAKAGQPFSLEPWQQAFVGNLFGWIDKKTDYRRYREAILYVGRKNGKTPLASGIVDYMLFVDGEPGAQIYSAAADRDQAALIYRHAAGMIQRDADLSARCKVYKSMKAIEVPETVSIYKALSSVAETKHGHSVHCALIDELHAHKNRDLVDVLITGTGARTQPLIIHITTADFMRESVCNEKYDYGCRVRDGLIPDAAFLPAIYEADAKADWTSPDTWRCANPNLGVSIYPEYLERECAKAQDSSALENIFKRLHLNIRTETSVLWLNMDRWRTCGDAIDLATLAGRSCYAGMDLATTSDITAFVLWFPPEEDDEAGTLLPFFWIPEVTIEQRSRRDQAQYAQWARDGLLVATPGNVTDYRFIRAQINELGQRYSIQQIAFDPWNATHLATELGEDDGFNMVQFRQGHKSMNEPSKEFERLVIAAAIRHGGNAVLTWMASNAVVRTDPAGNIKPDKAKSHEKIDGIVSAIMAIGLAMAAPAYVEPEIVFV